MLPTSIIGEAVNLQAYQSFEEHAERINEEVEYVTIQSHANYDNMDVECSHS